MSTINKIFNWTLYGIGSFTVGFLIFGTLDILIRESHSPYIEYIKYVLYIGGGVLMSSATESIRKNLKF